jgi:hypothetical protein
MLEFAPGGITVSGLRSAYHVHQAGQGESALTVEILGDGDHRDIA